MKKYFYELMTDARHGPIDKIVCGFLYVLSLGYGIILKLTRFLYQAHLLPVYKSPKPVISVGNLTVGGTGKTPLVIAIVRLLQAKGFKVVVLSRGYGSKDGNNDEVKMFKEILPSIKIVTGVNRRLSIEGQLKQDQVDIFVADDAFSHFPLKRDLNIVTINVLNPFGNGFLIPRGILREEINALKRADIFVLTKCDQSKQHDELIARLLKIKPTALIVKAKHSPLNFQNIFTSKIHQLDEFKERKIIAFSAIADPFSFEDNLEVLKLNTFKHLRFMDHHTYTDKDIYDITGCARLENINILVTTHKDAVKITGFQHLFKDFLVLKLNISINFIESQEEFLERIISL